MKETVLSQSKELEDALSQMNRTKDEKTYEKENHNIDIEKFMKEKDALKDQVNKIYDNEIDKDSNNNKFFIEILDKKNKVISELYEEYHKLSNNSVNN